MLIPEIPSRPLYSVLLTIGMLFMLVGVTSMIPLYVDGVAIYNNGWIGGQEGLTIPCGITEVSLSTGDTYRGVLVECRDDTGKHWGLDIPLREEAVELKEKMNEPPPRGGVSTIEKPVPFTPQAAGNSTQAG